MKILLLTNEYPPNIYGGAGVHVGHLSRALSKIMAVDVRSFVEPAPSAAPLTVQGFPNTRVYPGQPQLGRVFDALQRCLDFNTAGTDASLVHVHTWYTHMAGIWAKLNYGIPLVTTVHSLEPLRPWKREQLGDGYDFSCWVEKTALEMSDAVIAVSGDTASDIRRLFNVPAERLSVIPNGIDAEELYPVNEPETLRNLGVDPDRPYVLFLGRITRQKGIIHLVRSIGHLSPGIQVVLCASSPDTPEIGREMESLVNQVRGSHPHLVWIKDIVPASQKRALYSHAAVFCCPSIYEPFGIINLEAMACQTPVVASRVGGIPEAVSDGETGLLVPVALRNDILADPVDPEQFSRDLAAAINTLLADPVRCRHMGEAGRRRVLDLFSWDHVARQTAALYTQLLTRHGK